ncbi:MAG: PilZ domain-containing protein [Burkholderiales bacterium]|nr:PilZ domain-containing protein [Burkholderiales bacterium]
MATKEVLIPVDPSTIAVGKRLPWALYARNGELLAPEGFLITDESQQRRMLEARAYRQTPGLQRNDATYDSESRAPATAVVDTLPELRHNVEFVQLTYHLRGEVDPTTVTVEFLGKVVNQAVMVTAPHLPGRLSWRDVEDGFPISVRMMTGRSAYSFETLLTRFSALPMPHLFLRYPMDVKHQVLRSSVRVRTSIKAVALLPGGTRHMVLVDNLSGDGCGIDTEFALGDPGENIEMVFRIHVRGQGYTLTLPSTIRNKRQRKGRHIYGLQFGSQNDPLDHSLRLALEAYLYEHIVTE